MSRRDLAGATTIPDRDAIEAASGRIAPYIRRTPVLPLAPSAPGAPLVLKLEHLQVTGSFKPRGAFNALLSADVPPAGVIAASGGNFGLAVGYAASTLAHHAEIFVPESSPAAKIDRVRRTGADVRVIPGYYDDAAAASNERALETGAVRLHPFDQIEVVEGGGTVGAEIEDQVPDADTILVAVGGGGLIGGIASWFGGRVRIVGVEPETSRCLHAAREAGEPVDVEVSGIAADSLGPRRIGTIAFAVSAAGFIDRSVLVSDEAIHAAQIMLWEEARVVSEPGGAAALAALATGAYRPEGNERIVVLVCGANADPGSVA
jgi:threonine dehydratase